MKMYESKERIHVNYGDAEAVARIFMHHPHIHGVELFGSVARDGQGNDLDLILVTDVDHGVGFLRAAGMKLRQRNPLETKDLTHQRIDTYNNPIFRAELAQEVLGGNFSELFSEAARLTNGKVDIFVFPYTWRQSIVGLQEDLPHKDPNFIANIARDAVKIA